MEQSFEIEAFTANTRMFKASSHTKINGQLQRGRGGAVLGVGGGGVSIMGRWGGGGRSAGMEDTANGFRIADEAASEGSRNPRRSH